MKLSYKLAGKMSVLVLLGIAAFQMKPTKAYAALSCAYYTTYYTDDTFSVVAGTESTQNCHTTVSTGTTTDNSITENDGACTFGSDCGTWDIETCTDGLCTYN